MRKCAHISLLLLACCFTTSLVGCAGQDQPEATSSRRSSQNGNTSVSIDDDEVLEAVLTDLTRNDSDELPLSLIRKTPRDVYFVPSTMDDAPQPLVPIEHNDGWQQLQHLDRTAIDEATDSLRERHGEHSMIKDFDPEHDLIHVIDTPKRIQDAGDDVPYGALYPVQAWLPGYSSDRNCAVVHLFFSEVLHPSYATYVLTKNENGWHIEFRGFITYL